VHVVSERVGRAERAGSGRALGDALVERLRAAGHTYEVTKG
jgi:hypothetical protein